MQNTDQTITLVYSNNVNDPTKGNIYIGGLRATQKCVLEEKSIKGVISVLKGIKLKLDQSVAHFTIQIDDAVDEQIFFYFKDTTDFLNDYLLKTNVLVHSTYGISRSPSIVIAYLMKTKLWKYEQTLDFLQQKRHCIEPNSGFVYQLQKYDETLNSLRPRKSKQINPL